MNILDYTLVALYLIAMLWLGQRFKRSRAGTDYFLGGKRFGSFSLSMSAMATQLGAVSFISAPAFVGLRRGGGMQWLTYEFGVPLAMIGIMVLLGPVLYRSGVVSVYAFLEDRLGRTSRQMLSALFMLDASFSAAVTVNVVCTVLGSIMGIAFWKMMLLLGTVTVAYALEGGMKAIVYSEVAQMIIKFLGIITIVTLGVHYVGGWAQFVAHVDQKRLQAVDFSSFGFDGREFGFWPMLIGGFFLYLSYYGTSQTQAQRLLSARNENTIRHILLINGLLRFPVTFAYCLGGLVLGTFVALNAEFAAQIPTGRADLMIPMFVKHYLPHGVIALIVIALLAAGMSAFSSYINSLSAVTMEDFIARSKALSKERYVTYSRAVTLAWGAVTMCLAFVADKVAATAIEATNMVSSLFLGPIVGMFLLAASGRRLRPGAATLGAAAGVLTNVVLWLFYKNIFWFWWNAIGAIVTLTLGICAGFVGQRASTTTAPANGSASTGWPAEAWILVIYFAAMVALCVALPQLL
jgi:SSS family transporter